MWTVNKTEDFDLILNEQLGKLQTDYVDFYLLHALDKQKWLSVKTLNLFSRAEMAIKDGRIKHLGFSFHDDLAVFKEIS